MSTNSSINRKSVGFSQRTKRPAGLTYVASLALGIRFSRAGREQGRISEHARGSGSSRIETTGPESTIIRNCAAPTALGISLGVISQRLRTGLTYVASRRSIRDAEGAPLALRIKIIFGKGR